MKFNVELKIAHATSPITLSFDAEASSMAELFIAVMSQLSTDSVNNLTSLRITAL